MLRFFCLVSLAVLVSESTLAQSQSDPTPEQCRALLQTSLVQFYLPHSIDREFGGYHEELDQAGSFKPGSKFLTLQARQLWFFSTLALHGIETEASIVAANTGYEFLREHFLDREHGGYFLKTQLDGTSLDTHKHVYPNAFVIYGLVEYHRATGRTEPLEQAMELFDVLEAKAYDRSQGGYREYFHADWRPVTDTTQPGIVGTVGTKTYNSHLHLLEAFAQLYRETKSELVGRRIGELITINTTTVKNPWLPCNLDGWNEDWTMIRTDRNLRASYGHDVECSWLVLDAAEALGRPSATLRSWAEAICGYSLKHGYDQEHGGFYYSGPLGKASDDQKKEWWTQSEALVAMLTMYRLTGKKKYADAFRRTFQFVSDHHIHPDGGWRATLNAAGVELNGSRSSMWQGAYHNGRALLMCEKLLRESNE
ncbi:MAG: AGE family epimerase/isomerase [Planctomycetota bacterium]